MHYTHYTLISLKCTTSHPMMPQWSFPFQFSSCHFIAMCWFLWSTHHYILDRRTQSSVPKVQYWASAFPFCYFLKTYITTVWMWGMPSRDCGLERTVICKFPPTDIYVHVTTGAECSLWSFFRMSSVIWKITNYETPHYIIFSISTSFNAPCFQ